MISHISSHRDEYMDTAAENIIGFCKKKIGKHVEKTTTFFDNCENIDNMKK